MKSETVNFLDPEIKQEVGNDDVAIELTRILYGNALRSNIAVLTAAAIIVFIFWNRFPLSFLLGWSCCIVVCVLYRFILMSGYQTLPPAGAQIVLYRARYIRAISAVALCWMVIVAAGLRLPEFEYRLYIVLLLVSLLGASVPALAASLTAIYIYVLVPASVAVPLLFLQGGADRATGVALICYAFMMLKSGQNVHNALVAAITLRVNLEKLKNNLEIKVAERTAELEISRDLEKQANQTKSVFIANMSHEIRTPMNAIINLSHLVLQEELSAKTRDFIRIVHESGVRLLELINDILDFSKIESGKLKIERIPLQIGKMVDEIRNELGFMAEKKGLAFTVNIDTALPGEYLGDPLRVRQILNNIVSNAIKFTDSGKVEMTVREIDNTDGKSMVEFTVIDSGIGIPPEQIQYLFHRFHQADDSTTRKYGGSGLGLAISLQLAELMGGSITVESAYGAGSTFRVRLPFEANQAVSTDSEKPGDGKITPESELDLIAGARVLVVDDIVANQVILASILENVKIAAISASSGKEALARLEEHGCDLVFMDIQMPDMDGYQTTRFIRNNPKWAKLPIIAVTANALPEDVQKCYEAGMDFCLIKPFNLDEVHRTLVKWIVTSPRLASERVPQGRS